jgi:hypothetical protein
MQKGRENSFEIVLKLLFFCCILLLGKQNILKRYGRVEYSVANIVILRFDKINYADILQTTFQAKSYFKKSEQIPSYIIPSHKYDAIIS